MSAAVTAALAPCLLDEVCSSASSKRTAEQSHPGIRESDLIASNEQIFDLGDGVISGTCWYLFSIFYEACGAILIKKYIPHLLSHRLSDRWGCSVRGALV